MVAYNQIGGLGFLTFRIWEEQGMKFMAAKNKIKNI